MRDITAESELWCHSQISWHDFFDRARFCWGFSPRLGTAWLRPSNCGKKKSNSVGSVALSIDKKKGSYFGAPETGHLGQSIRKRSPVNFPCPETRSEVVDSVSTDFRDEVLGRGNVRSSVDVVLSTPSFAHGTSTPTCQ